MKKMSTWSAVACLGFFCALTGMDQLEQFMLGIKKYELDKARAIEQNRQSWKYFVWIVEGYPIPFDSIQEPSDKSVLCTCLPDKITILQYVPCEHSSSELFYQITGPRTFNLWDWVLLPCTLLRNCISPYTYYRRNGYEFFLSDATWKNWLGGDSCYTGEEEATFDTSSDMELKTMMRNRLWPLIQADEWAVSVERFYRYMAVVVPAKKMLGIVVTTDRVSMFVPHKLHDCFMHFDD